MKNRLLGLLIIGLMGLGFTNANADIAGHGYPNGDYYVGANLGYSLFAYPSGATSKKKTPINIGASFGKTWELSNFTSYLGYELQANYYGNASFKIGGNKVTAKIFQINVFFTGYQYFNTEWNIHGKVGAGYQIDSLSGGNYSTVSNIAPVLSIGMGYRFSPTQSLSVDYTHTFGKTGSALSGKKDIMQIDVLSIGWQYHF